MRWSGLLAVGLLVLATMASDAQVQPAAPPSPAGFTVREELAGAGDLAGAKRVLRFVQVSDAHILDDDAPYPLRQEPLDPYITAFSTSAQRPQDEYTDEVLESIVRAINAEHAKDAFQFVVNTGDNIDNDLENELMRFIDLWDGTAATKGPVSGLDCVPDGQSTGLDDASHDVTDRCTSLPESLLANRTALAPGLPWYSAFGNHDTLIQGNVNPNQPFDGIAGEFGRHLLTQPEYVRMHFPGLDPCPGGAAGDDFGHGYGLADEPRRCDEDPDNDGYYAFVVGGVRFVVLDTINDDFAAANGFTPATLRTESIAGADIIGGYAEGAVDPAQMAWLRAQVAEHPDQLVVVLSHHTVNSMFTNLADGYCAPGLGCLSDLLVASGYGTGETLTAELAGQANVAAWIGGHTHRNRIEPKGAAGAGFWNIESSSLIDHPQQARVVELWVTADGAKGAWVLSNLTHDFALSRELELTDGQRDAGAIGQADDQDTILWFDVPSAVVFSPMRERGLLTLFEETVRHPFHNQGDIVSFGVTVLDAATNLGVPGLNGTFGVGHWDNAGKYVVDVPNGTKLQDQGQGLYTGPFVTTACTASASVHFAGRDWQELQVDLPRKMIAPVSKECINAIEDSRCGQPGAGTPDLCIPKKKDTPTSPLLPLVALAAAFIVARRR